jgi:hypothetical protein
MTAQITITRDSSLRSMGVLYDVTIDGAVVGRLKRNQSLTPARPAPPPPALPPLPTPRTRARHRVCGVR